MIECLYLLFNLAVGRVIDNGAEINEIIKAISVSGANNINGSNLVPALVWNISDKEFLTSTSNLFNHQIVDMPWVTPGSFTHSPTIQSVLVLCYALQSWIDIGTANSVSQQANNTISNAHISLLHCANGKTRTGIVVSCLLKYNGTCSSCMEAFALFCRYRYSILRNVVLIAVIGAVLL